MSLDLGLGPLVNAASGLLLLVLGLAIARLGPRLRANAALALFSACFGADRLANLLTDDDALQPAILPTRFVLQVVAALALLALALWFPGALRGRQRRLLAFPAGVGAGVGALFLAIWVVRWDRWIEPLGPARFFPSLAFWEFLGEDAGFALLSASMFAALYLFAARFLAASGPGAARVRRQLAVVSGALLMDRGVTAGNELAFGAADPEVIAMALVLLAGLSLLWLRAAAYAREPDSRAARDLALLAVGLPFLGMLGTYLGGGDNPSFGLARVAAALLLAYGILRHQLLGIDVRVKWTLKQSTVAAAFIGVFFVVSESASQFFADADGGLGLGTYLGIAAAGLLVFALAPLQRAAEKVADTAMPGVKAPRDLNAGERRRIYREQAVAAWQDGAISRDERLLLDRLREGLGLSRDEASRLESEAARA